jgi:hypothetical protein
LQILELDGNTEIAFWNRQIQKALEVTDSHLANKEIQAERNFFFALQEERQSSGLPANAATVVEGSDSGEGQLPDTVTGLLEEIPDEATLAEELAQQQTLNKEKRGEILEEITQLKGKSGVELELAKLNQKVQDLTDHCDELAHLCEAKKLRYRDQQKFRKSGEENLWVYYCTLAQRMEEIFIASKAESSLLMGKTIMAGSFKVAAVGITLASKAISMIVKLSEEVLKGAEVVTSVAEFLNEERQHNIIRRISLLGSLSDCKKAAYYVARHLTERYAEQCLQISQDPTKGRIKQAKEWLETNLLANKTPSPIALVAECAVQCMLDALMVDWIKAPNDKQEVSEWLGEQLVDEVSKPLTETGTLVNTVSLKVQSVYQSLCAWFALNTIQTNDGREWIISQIYTHTGIRVEGIEYIDPNDLEMIEDKTDQTPVKGEIKTKEKKIEPKTNYRLYGCYEGTMDRVTLCGYKALPKNQESQVTATAQQSTQANTTDQSKVASARPPVSSKDQAQTNHSSANLPSQQGSSIQSMHKYTEIIKSEYWYKDTEINRLLLIVSGDLAQVAVPQAPLIEGQNGKRVPCPEVDARCIQFFQGVIQGALEKDKPTLIPINTVSAVTLDDNGVPVGGIEGIHWVLLVLRPNQNEHHRPDIQYIDPLGNGYGADKDLIVDDSGVILSNSYFILNLIKQAKYKQQTINPKTFIVTGLRQQDNGSDCGPYLIENAIAVLKSQGRAKYTDTDMRAVRERHAKWLQNEDANKANRQGTGAETAAEATKLAAAQVSAQSTPTAYTAKQGAIPVTASSSTVKVGEIGSGKNKVGGKNIATTEYSSQKKAPPSGGSSTEKKYANPTASSTNHMSNDTFLKFVRTELENFESKLKKDQDQILDNLNKTLPEEIKEKIKHEISADLKSVEKQLQGLMLQNQGLNADLKEKNELERSATRKNDPNEVVDAHQLNPMKNKLSELEKQAKEDQLDAKGLEELYSLREKIEKVETKMTIELLRGRIASLETQLQEQQKNLERLESEEKVRAKAINTPQDQLVLEKAAHDSEIAALKEQQKEQDKRIQSLEQALNKWPNQPAQDVSADVQSYVEIPVAPPEMPADQAAAAAPPEIVGQQNGQESIVQAITLGFQR